MSSVISSALGSFLFLCTVIWPGSSSPAQGKIERVGKTGFDKNESSWWHAFTPVWNKIFELFWHAFTCKSKCSLFITIAQPQITLFCQNSVPCNAKSGNTYCLSLNTIATSWEEKEVIKRSWERIRKMTCRLAPDGRESCCSLQYDYSKNTGGTLYREGLKTMTMITPDNHFD